MTGIGVDAEVMAKTNEKVKGVLGWPAYVFAGIGRMFSRGFMVQVSSAAATRSPARPQRHRRQLRQPAGRRADARRQARRRHPRRWILAPKGAF